MKKQILRYTLGLALFGMAFTAPAQSTWNYYITDAGDGNSLVTWNVTGSILTSATWKISYGGWLGIQVSAPGIYADAYASSFSSQSIPTPDGSVFYGDAYYQLGTDITYDINEFVTQNYSDGGPDSFGLVSPGGVTAGQQIKYIPGTESVLIPVDFSNFNPGTYQSVYAAGTYLDTTTTITLTVEGVPEPTTLALAGLGALGCALMFWRRKS